MSVVAIVPVRSFAFGKQRLAESLTVAQRSALGQSLALHVTSTAAAAGAMPLVVTSDAEVAEWSIRNGLPVVEDPGTGLDDAVATGLQWVNQSGTFWIVLHSDLPLLTLSDVQQLIAAFERSQSPIAPSMDGGTSALGGRSPIETSYGSASFHRHLSLLATPHVVATTGLLHDIDSQADLISASEHRRGAWITDLIS